jgi:hypothetical protein
LRYFVALFCRPLLSTHLLDSQLRFGDCNCSFSHTTQRPAAPFFTPFLSPLNTPTQSRAELSEGLAALGGAAAALGDVRIPQPALRCAALFEGQGLLGWMHGVTVDL